VCQSRGFSWPARLQEIVRRRGLLAPLAIGAHLVQAVGPLLRSEGVTVRRIARRAFSTMRMVPDIHAPEVLQYVRGLTPDLGLIYGAPMLRPELFEIPRLGTLGIHHGTLPAYRGRKTTFWEVYNGERTAGVVIQRVTSRLDAGEIVAQRGIPIAGQRYWRVAREVGEAGVALYVDAILAMRNGALIRPPADATRPGRIYHEPTMRDWLHLVRRRFTRRPAAR
jgi:methionyl-tRNA formyltransferase